jgi:phosphohistidine phosphatase
LGVTVKHLLLLRHAKAMTGEPGMADRDRPLAPRGHRDAALMGKAIAAEPPDAILCSPARRTRETLAEILPSLKNKPRVVYIDALYGAPGDYAKAIMENAGGAERLLVVGHNPTIHVTALLLAGSRRTKLRDAIAAKFPTAALAVIAFKAGDWSEIRAGAGKLIAFVRPRDLGSEGAED